MRPPWNAGPKPDPVRPLRPWRRTVCCAAATAPAPAFDGTGEELVDMKRSPKLVAALRSRSAN